ncbi:MAG: hypothetical protein R3D66_04510 [Alphaproteobacteria bacterium]
MSKNAIGTFLAAPLASAHPSLKYIACFGAGSLSALSMAPANLWPALFIGLGTLSLLLLQTARSRFQAFAFGWLFGFGYFLFGLSWIGNALLVEGNPYRWAWPLAVSGLPALLAFFPALATLASFAFLNLKRLSGALGFIALMSFSEWLRGHIFTGFPWNLYGYTWVESLPLIQCVSFGSIYLLTMLTLLWACTPGLLLALPRKEGALLAFLALGTFAACFSFGLWRLNTVHIQDREDVSVKLVQPNIVQSENGTHGSVNRHFETLLTLSQAQDTDTAPLTLIIWPETAISHFFTADPIAMRRVSAMLSTYSGKCLYSHGAATTRS